MKQAPILLGGLFILFVGAFSITKAQAFILQGNDYNTTTPICYAGGNEQVGSCSGGVIDSQKFGQLLQLPTQQLQSPSSITIDSVGIQTSVSGANAGTLLTARLLNENLSLLASGTLADNLWVSGTTTISFTTPYTYSWNDATSSRPYFIEFERGAGGTKVLQVYLSPPQYGSPFYDEFNEHNIGGFPNAYYGYKNNSYEEFTNDRQLIFELNQTSVIPLTIEYPVVDINIYGGSTNAYGTCEDAVDLVLYTGNIATTTAIFSGVTAACTSNVWTTILGGLSQGQYYLTASSSGQFADTTFFHLSGTASTEETLNFLGPNPFQIDEEDLGFWGFLNDWSQSRMNFRPYSYFPLIIGSLLEGMDNVTTTDWLAAIEVNTSVGTVTLPGLTSTLFDDIDPNFKNTIRSFSAFVLYAGFIFYIWRLRYRFT